MNATTQETSGQTELARHPYVQQLESELQQLHAALRRNEEQWRATFEQTAVGMAHMALDGQFLRVNQRYCTMLGYRADELLGKTVQALTHPDDLPDNSTLMGQLLTGEIRNGITHKRCFHKNGTIVWGRLTISLAYLPAGLPDYFVMVFEDITAVKQTEDALYKSEERYRRIVEDQTDLICRFQPDFRLTFVNRAYAESTGKAPNELIGVRILDLIPPEYQTQVMNQIAVQNPTGRAATSENPVWLSDGSLHWFEWTDQAIVDEQGAIVEYQAVGRDVTARRQAEAAERTQRQFAEALLDSLVALTSSLDIDQVMAQILTSAATVMPSDAGCIILFEGGYGRFAYSRGFTAEATTLLQQSRVAIDTWVSTRNAFAHKMPYLVLDTYTDKRWSEFPLTGWIRSSIGVPIERAGELIGLLIADSATPNYFTAADVDKLQAFARYAGLALNNAYQATLLEQQVTERTVELQAAKDQVETILDHNCDGIVLVQPDLSIVQSNRAFCTLFGCQSSACQGRSLLNFIEPADVSLVKAEMMRAWQQEDAILLETHACRLDGSRFDVELSSSTIKDMGLVCTLRDITARKARERQLRYYASLQENVSEAVITTDLQAVIQSWNKAAESIYGWRAEEVIGKKSSSILQTHYLRPFDHEQVWQALWAQGHWQEEVIQHHKNGAPLHILASLTLLRDAQGNGFGVVAINRDITAQKQTEAALAESRHFAAQITEAAPNNIYIYDLQAQCNVYSNKNIAGLLGYSPAEIKAMGRQWVTTVMHPDDYERFLEHAKQFRNAQDHEIVVFTYRMRHKDGAWRWFESHDTIFRRDDRGEPTQLLGVAADITERKQASERLRTQRDFLQQVIDNVPALISVKDRAGRFQLVNKHAAQIFGITAEAMIGRIDVELNPNPAEVAFFRRKDQEALDSGHPIFVPEQMILEKPYQTNKIPLRNEAGEFDRLLIVSVDISIHKRAEAALQQTLQREKELSELKSSFITTTSHEFRTPLAIILSLTETLSAYRHRLTDAQIADRLTKIQQQVEHLKTLMVDVLELARIQARKTSFTPVAVHPAAFCRELLAEFQSIFTIAQRLVYHGDDKLPVMHLDKRLFRQILTNLLSNAIKYSAVDKPVTIKVTGTDALLTLQMQDEGIGIPAADLKHLCQPFQRASNVGILPGTGLGLAITKEAVELHGGTLTLTSTLDVGTTVTVTIPAVRLPA